MAGMGCELVFSARMQPPFCRAHAKQRQFSSTFLLGTLVIFGFNTDVKYADTVYHVQSEAREHDLLLQTQVFVKGRCIGKHTTSYAETTKEQGFSEEHTQALLKDQHKYFVTAVREGRIEAEFAGKTVSVLGATPAATDPTVAAKSESPAAAAARQVEVELALTPVGTVIGRGIILECLPPAPAADGKIMICVQVADENGPAVGAQVSCRVSSGTAAATYVYATSSAGGVADVDLTLAGLDLSATLLLIQATHRGKSATRKYKLTMS